MFVPRQAEIGVVEMALAIVFIVRVQGRIDDAADGGLSLEIGRGDLDLLEAEHVRPFPSLEIRPERGSPWRGRGRGWLEEGGDGWGGGGRKERADAVDVPGVDAETVRSGRGGRVVGRKGRRR